MKFKSLLLFSASCVLLGNQAIAIVPIAKTVAQAPTSNLPKASDAYRNCQQAANAVVTLYSGTEIGTGSILNTDGTILTAQHVVKEAIRSPNKVKIYVKLANGNRYIGRAIASDARNDLALVQIPVNETLQTVALASDASLQTGQKVCAIGSPAGRTGVLSQGTFQNMLANGDLQSAVRLTYGNSGGPLLNAQGVLVGVNKAIWLSSSGQNTGISYATSAQVAQAFINQNRRTTTSSIGVQPIKAPMPASLQASVVFSPQALSPQQPIQAQVALASRLGASFGDQGMTVQQVEPNSPAALGGLQQGDRLIAINGNRVSGQQQLEAFLSQQPSTAVLTLDRHQQVTNIQVNF
ncbi:MAG: S1C family serine protease [Stenomitos rutilans HA7619-LM2]|jgi:serine protease Do|nr:S1C family serine protease [Stenomitos rutilans HA7619-LM2]